ncbi:MAG: DUF2911 domain-containing protein [Lewinellaceae bacterium]|nr:DUF2911 domain-containing protein [Phaeodactylibacter sp.]MCB9040411.1 DUF2911 domain-containing protein [Lewinellaceae bacterium]
MKRIVHPSLLSIFLFFLAIISLSAQPVLTTPQASQKAYVGQTVGLTDVVVKYHRPAVKGREIWGKLVPMNAVWRAGANENTIIKFSTDVRVEGQALAAGAYGLHMIPTDEKWTVIFSTNYSSWGSFGYKQEEDALRVEVQPEKAGRFYEYLTYEFEDVGEAGAVCALKWADKSIPFRIEADVRQVVLASMREELKGISQFNAQAWQEAANYCLTNDINQEEALGWASRSVFMAPNPQNLVVKAQLAGKVKGEGDAEKAAKVAMKTLSKDLESLPCTWKEYSAAANLALQHEQHEQALAWSEKAVTMAPNMTTMMAHAQALKATGAEAKAEKAKKEAIARGTNAELNAYGYQLLFSGKGEEALEIFEANVEKNPEDPNVWDSLGEGYVNTGHKEKAIKALKKSLSLDPPDNVRDNSLKLLAQLGVEYEAPKP